MAEGYVLPAYAAVEIARAAIAAAERRRTARWPTSVGRDFETAIGPIRFDDKGDLAENPYRVFRFDGDAFVPVEVPDVPRPARAT